MHHSNLAEIQQLLTYLQEQAVDSYNIAITPEETTRLAGCLLERLVFKSLLLDEIIQEELDNLRYQVHPCGTEVTDKYLSEPEHYSFTTESEG